MTKQEAISRMCLFGTRLGALSGIVVGIVVGLPIFVIGALFGLFIGLFLGLIVGLVSGFLVGIISITFFSPIYKRTLYRITAWLICSSLSCGATFMASRQIFSSMDEIAMAYWYGFILVLSIIAATIASQRLANWYIRNSSGIVSAL